MQASPTYLFTFQMTQPRKFIRRTGKTNQSTGARCLFIFNWYYPTRFFLRLIIRHWPISFTSFFPILMKREDLNGFLAENMNAINDAPVSKGNESETRAT